MAMKTPFTCNPRSKISFAHNLHIVIYSKYLG